MRLLLFLIINHSLFAALISRFTISQYILPSKMLKMEMEVIAPLKHGEYPAILYMTGFAGLIPWYMQAQLMQSIAQSGYVVMVISEIQNFDPNRLTKILESIMLWINQHLQYHINLNMPGVKADIQNRFMFMSHSAASHSMTQYLNGTCGNVKLQILLDPVDGSGLEHAYIITPGEFLPYATPVIVIQAALDPIPKIGTTMPCAPEDVANMRFYNAMSGPKWFVNISNYGHGDFFDNEYRMLADAICSTCHQNCNFKQYRNLIKDIIINFSTGILEKNEQKLKWIEGYSTFSIQTIKKFDYMGYSPSVRGGFCERKQLNRNLITE